MCINEGEELLSGHVDICDLGVNAYREALRGGRVPGEMPSCIIEMGLIRYLSKTGECVAVPPDVALFGITQPIEYAILDNQHRLAAIRVSMSRLEDVYLEAQKDESLVRRLIGADVISTALEQAVSSCASELLTMQPGGGRAPALLAEALPRDLRLAARGVHQYTLYQHSVRTHGPTLSYVEQVTAAGAEVRTSEQLFERLIVCDRTVAFIPTVLSRSTEALVVRDPGIVQYLVKSFWHEWTRAEPMLMHSGPRLDILTEGIRLSVLRLLVTGLPDKAIANKLGISLRSVANHVKRTSDVLGSSSRAELGYLLAVHRVVEPPRGARTGADPHADAAVRENARPCGRVSPAEEGRGGC